MRDYDNFHLRNVCSASYELLVLLVGVLMLRPKFMVGPIRSASRLGWCCVDIAALESFVPLEYVLASRVQYLSAKKNSTAGFLPALSHLLVVLDFSSKLLNVALNMFLDNFFAGSRPATIGIYFQGSLPFL